ncbi:6-phosphofructokinase [Mesomycoplasma neurolyticum]|uniref:6-phosphofructokinase n=1 Tax=Mesomycoplasma neurolyticum TaxID=2120 RepID=A0A449A6I8_9BACT|nr:6-phosphofructokinase [Mesomycoplasma neurolyticum]VEU59871.1 6-phosphofructokinase [Mesomycoplasma neurolyticum]
MEIKKIAILTSGGDAPGMNNVIRAVVKSALLNNIEPFLVYGGYKGLYKNKIVSTTNKNVDKYLAQGGTFIYSTRFPKFKNPEIRQEAIGNLKRLGIDALLVIGGNGSYAGALKLHEEGIKVLTIPGTIDNDINSSEFTLGYDTALNTIVEAVDKLRDTATSHSRFFIVETMGHGAGDLALYSGIATGAEIIVTNEKPMTVDEIIAVVHDQVHNRRKRSVIAIVSEFIYPNLDNVAKAVQAKTKVSARAMKLGHLQRGGRPSAQDRILGTLMVQK